jgi:heme A synthase
MNNKQIHSTTTPIQPPPLWWAQHYHLVQGVYGLSSVYLASPPSPQHHHLVQGVHGLSSVYLAAWVCEDHLDIENQNGQNSDTSNARVTSSIGYFRTLL